MWLSGGHTLDVTGARPAAPYSRFRADLFDRIGPALGLGRSFIRPEYQKQYAPLLLPSKSIGRYAGARPECATLFGGVTISGAYQYMWWSSSIE